MAEEPVIANCIIKKLNEGKVKCFEWDASPPLDVTNIRQMMGDVNCLVDTPQTVTMRGWLAVSGSSVMKSYS